MIDPSKMSNGELYAEMERRKIARRAPPKPLNEPNFEKLGKFIIDSIGKTDLSGEEVNLPRNFRYDVWSKAMEAVYGDKFWTWHENVVNSFYD